MIILGISGFEDIRSSSTKTFFNYRSNTIEDLLCFKNGKIPLQFFPLHLIGHDCSAALLIDGQLVAFAAEERFSRIKHGLNLTGRTVLPRKAIDYCLKQAGITWDQIDYIGHFSKFTEESIVRRLNKMKIRIGTDYYNKLEYEYFDTYNFSMKKDILETQLEEISGISIDQNKLIQVRHHLAHAAGTFYSSHFNEALIMTVDGYGEEESSLWALGTDAGIKPVNEIKLPTSLGLLYQTITAYLGFYSIGDEYKVMGLSSYGDGNSYKSFFDNIIDLKSDGSYEINCFANSRLFQQLKETFGKIDWQNGQSKKAADIAASLQRALEKTLLHSLLAFKEKYNIKKLCFSGGVALNATANGVILRSGLFDEVFFQPAAADDGTSLGAALYIHNDILQKKRNNSIDHTYWGPSYNSKQVEKTLKANRHIKWEKHDDIEQTVAELLAKGKIIGWFQGRMEMGPRALGARSILADPRQRDIRDRLNLKIKNRESFRPFAPSVIKEQSKYFFELNSLTYDPYMLTTVPVKKEKQKLIPGVVHIDGTSRIQTVSEENNPRYFRLLSHFFKRTGIPMLLNTSFNHASEPIVCTPDDALNCFLRCKLDALAIEDYLILPLNSMEADNE